jgi:hypothetical protein
MIMELLRVCFSEQASGHVANFSEHVVISKKSRMKRSPDDE